MTTLSLLVIYAQNLEVSCAFYRALGLTFIQEQHDSGPIHYACECENIVIEIYPAKTATDASTHNTMLGFQVASLGQALSALQKLGIEPKSPPKVSSWGRWVNVTDPDGRTVQLSENSCS